MLGPIFIDLESTVLTKDEPALLLNPWVGGVVLFARNYSDRNQVKALTQSIRAIRPELIICVDHEGGRVQRFREGFTEIPAMATFGVQYDEDPTLARKSAYHYGRIVAMDLQNVGIDFTFSPVLDLDFGHSQIMATRCFHAKPEAVSLLAGAFIDGLASRGMPCVGKHFPGHGYVKADSHVAHPVDDRSLEVIMRTDLVPYRQLAAKLTGVMTAHVKYPLVDESIASYSPFWLKTVLRSELAYEGVIFSDDLIMSAANGYDMRLRVQAALAAGCDVALICNDRPAVELILGELSQAQPAQSARLSTLHGAHFYESVHDAIEAELSELGLALSLLG